MNDRQIEQMATVVADAIKTALVSRDARIKALETELADLKERLRLDERLRSVERAVEPLTR